MAFRVVPRWPGWAACGPRNYTSDAAFPAGFRVPELPEVEAVARDVRRDLRGSAIIGVHVHRWDVVAGGSRRRERLMLGGGIERVLRHGKQLALIGLDGSVLVVQLGMTGEFGVVPDGTEAAPHTHVSWRLDHSRELRFVDPRRFGGITWLADRVALETRWSLLGPDALDLRSGWFVPLTQGRRAIKAALLDQRSVAGVGNIYADEALAMAGIKPHRLCCHVPPAAFEALGKAIGSVMRLAIERGGSTIRTYRRLGGGPGAFQGSLRVYGRAGLPCVKCAQPLRSALVASRTTVWCPLCQT